MYITSLICDLVHKKGKQSNLVLNVLRLEDEVFLVKDEVFSFPTITQSEVLCPPELVYAIGTDQLEYQKKLSELV